LYNQEKTKQPFFDELLIKKTVVSLPADLAETKLFSVVVNRLQKFIAAAES